MSFHASHSNRCLGEITLHEEDTQVVEHAVRIFARKPLVFQSLAPSLCLPVLYRQFMLKTWEYHHHTCSLLTGLFELP